MNLGLQIMVPCIWRIFVEWKRGRKRSTMGLVQKSSNSEHFPSSASYAVHHDHRLEGERGGWEAKEGEKDRYNNVASVD